jgi:hypothetical protein
MEHEDSLPRSHEPVTCLYLSQISPVYAFLSYFLKSQFNTALASTPKSYYCSYLFSDRFPHQNSVRIVPSYVPHAPPISLFLIWSPE